MAAINLPVDTDVRISTATATKNTNYITWNYWHTNSGYQWRTVFRPDFSSLPSAAIITAVSLKVYLEGGGAATDTIYRLRRQFVDNQVTGVIARTGVAWTAIGAENTSYDRYSTSSGSIVITDTAKRWLTIALNVSEFNALRTLNTGYLIKQTSGATERYYRGVRVGGYAPYFTVTYSLPTGRRRVIWFT